MFNLIQNRDNKNHILQQQNDNNLQETTQNNNLQTIFIENLHKKYAGINAFRVREDQMYMDIMIDHVKNSNYFLCASDSCNQITMLYHKCKLEANMADKDNFILITSKNKFPIYDASEQFRNKFVFYSPSIVFGIDFSIKEKKMYLSIIKGVH